MTPDSQHQRIMGYFIEEAREHLETIYNGFQNFSATIRDEEAVNEMFRAAHSIKGGAAMLGIEAVRFIASHLENFLGMIRENSSIRVDQELINLFLESYAYLPQLMNQLERSHEISVDMTEAAINAAQGTVARLSEHLQQLLAHKTDDDSSQGLDLVVQFQSVVKAIVVEMHNRLSEVRTDEATAKLLELCDELHHWGSYLEQQNLESSQWGSLVTVIREVINNPFNGFENLHEIVPQELEYASELVSKGRDGEICASSQLQDLITPDHGDPDYEDDEQTSNIFSALPLEGFTEEFADLRTNTSIQPPEARQTAIPETLAQFFDQNDLDMESAWQEMESDETQFFVGLPPSDREAVSGSLLSDQFDVPASTFLSEATPDLENDLDDLLNGSSNEESALGDAEGDLSALEQLDSFLKPNYEAEEEVTYMQMDADDVPSRDSSDENLAHFLNQSFDSTLDEFSTEDIPTTSGNQLFGSRSIDEDYGLGLSSAGSFRDNFDFSESLEEDLTEVLPDFADSLGVGTPLVDVSDEVLFPDAFDTQMQSQEIGDSDLSDDLTNNPFTDLADLNQEASDLMFDTGAPENLDQFLDSLNSDGDQDTYLRGTDIFSARMHESDLDNPFASPNRRPENRDFSNDLDSLFDSQESDPQENPDQNYNLDVLSSLTDTPPPASPEFNLFSDLSFTQDNVDRVGDLQTDGSDIFADLDQPKAQPLDNLLNEISSAAKDESDGTNNFDFLNELVGNELTPTPANNSELDDLSNFFDFGEDTRGLGMTEHITVTEPPFTGSNSYSPVKESAGEFAELEALIGGDDDFAHLEALLQESPAVGEMTFHDLEALLEMTPELTADPAVSHPELRIDPQYTKPPLESQLELRSESESITESPKEDKFADLENMLKGKFADVGKINTAPATPVTARNASRAIVNNVRVDVKYLDSLNNLVGELVVNRNLLWQDQERLQNFLTTLLSRVQQLGDLSQRMRDQYDRSLLESSLMVGRSRNQMFSNMAHDHHEGLPSVTADFDAIEFDRYNAFHILSQEIIELIVRIKESASDIEFVVTETEQVTRELGRIATQLQDDLKQSRMVPFANLADRLPRGIRDRAVKTGKQAELRIIGGDTLIDKAILEQLTDPMTHLVNNAVDHGLESPEERRRAGKPEQGMIEVKAYHQGNQTMITIRDDGGGINHEKVKEKAVKKGLKTTAEVARMTPNEAYELLFMAGFSTKEQADQFAGRGVGLDVVKSCLDNIKGSIYIDSQIGKGTQFIIRLPLTLSISKAIFCVIDGVRVAIPIDGFEDMVEVPREQVIVNNIGQDCIPWQDMMLPFRPLSSLLSFNRRLGRVYARQEPEEICVIIVRDSENNHLGLKVDQFLGEYEIVVKQLEGIIPKPPGVAGATVLGDGRVISIVNVLELFDIAEGRMKINTDVIEPIDDLESQSTQPIVLVVDDSIVVREMLSATFTKAGYFVESARDGQDAWDKLRGGMPCNLIFCDIEMPKMDGMQLLSRIQKDENLCQIPMAMLTSRAADKHRQTALQLGAKAYFTKPYLEEELLKASQKLLKGEALI